MRRIAVMVMAGILGFAGPLQAQTTPSDTPNKEFDSRFFQALQGIFENFRNADLQRAFQAAAPVGCSELLGDWRTTAFFSDDRNLERWYYKTFEEVQADLSRYIFQGKCGSETANLEVASRFPVRQSLEAYNRREIEFDRIAFRVNPPVRATFDSRTRAYSFESPYLYVTGRNGASSTYSMMPPDATAKYAQEVTNKWDCKAVKNADITYRFILCRTAILPTNRTLRSQVEEGARGTSAYILLTDGREARATFTLSFPTDATGVKKNAGEMARIADLGREDFRLRFVSRSWESTIASTTILAAGQFTAAESAALNVDHCEWRPQSPATAVLVDENEKTVQYYLTRGDRSGSSPAWFNFDARTAANFRLGNLRCVFPGAESAPGIEMKRLLSVFGDHITIEFR